MARRKKIINRPERLPRFSNTRDTELESMHRRINSKFVFHRDGDGIGVKPLYRFLKQIERELSARNINLVY